MKVFVCSAMESSEQDNDEKLWMTNPSEPHWDDFIMEAYQIDCHHAKDPEKQSLPIVAE